MLERTCYDWQYPSCWWMCKPTTSKLCGLKQTAFSSLFFVVVVLFQQFWKGSAKWFFLDLQGVSCRWEAHFQDGLLISLMVGACDWSFIHSSLVLSLSFLSVSPCLRLLTEWQPEDREVFSHRSFWFQESVLRDISRSCQTNLTLKDSNITFTTF